MKKTALLLLAALSLLALSACATPAVPASLGQAFSLKLGQTARITSEDLTLTFRSVRQDSRCPSGVT